MQSLYGAIANTNKKEIMAVSIDKVYQKVLALANKEQRGYITPQEFNLFADQAQMEIFEQYFYDINQWGRQQGNNNEYSDMLSNLEEKIDLFALFDAALESHNSYGDFILNSDLPDLYRLGSVRVKYSDSNRFITVEQLRSRKEFVLYSSSALTNANKKRPVYHRNIVSNGDDRIKIYPHPDLHDDNLYHVQADYLRKPKTPNWNYIVINDKPLYNSTNSQDFELHVSEEPELVYRILALAGIAVEKPQLSQMAVGLQTAQVQQEKQ